MNPTPLYRLLREAMLRGIDLVPRFWVTGTPGNFTVVEIATGTRASYRALSYLRGQVHEVRLRDGTVLRRVPRSHDQLHGLRNPVFFAQLPDVPPVFA